MRMQRFRQEKHMKFQPLRRKNITNSYNHQNNMNGFSSKQKLPLDNLSTKSDLVDDQYSNKSDQANSNNNNNNFENEKTSSSNMPVKSMNGCSNASNGNEISANADTSGSNKTINESLVDKSKLFWEIVMQIRHDGQDNVRTDARPK